MGKKHGSSAGKGIRIIDHRHDRCGTIVRVESDSDKRKRYTVTHTMTDNINAWACTCRSWVHQNGTHPDGSCKHIRHCQDNLSCTH